MPPSTRAARDHKPRRVCFVTGTRAEWGLMQGVLRAITATKNLKLQIIATGVHLDPTRGRTAASIPADALVPWPTAKNPADLARQTGQAAANIAAALHRLKTDIVLVVGDRVEAFAAASAAAISNLVVAHVHGGDRALGQVDDTLRHAITKLSHLHFPATKASARRIARLGESPRRIHLAGSPALDDIHKIAAAAPPSLFKNYALFLLHPTDTDPRAEFRRASILLRATLLRATLAHFQTIIAIYPNNDPGAPGIVRALQLHKRRLILHRHIDRPAYLRLLRDAAVLVGNSSSGIIEASAFATPVLNVGPRQLGRQAAPNVIHADFHPALLARILRRLRDHPPRRKPSSLYGTGHASQRIARTLAAVPLTDAFRRKLITY